MLRSFMQMTALILTLGASIFLLKSNLGLTPEVISKISSTCWGYNALIVEGFAKQAADTRVGVILLLLAFILQLINALWPMRIDDFGVSWHGVLISIGFCIIVVTIAHWYAKNLSEKINKNTMQIFEESKETTEKK